jgi:hypothetical protein
VHVLKKERFYSKQKTTRFFVKSLLLVAQSDEDHTQNIQMPEAIVRRVVT